MNDSQNRYGQNSKLYFKSNVKLTLPEHCKQALERMERRMELKLEN